MNKADFPLHTERANLSVDKERKNLKILVIQQKMIGDVLISAILCEALKKKHPTSIVHFVANSNTIPVIQENPFIDLIVEFKDEYSQSRRALFAFAKKIRKSNYDIIFDAYGKWESNLITLFSGAKEKISFYKWYTHFFYSKTIRNRSYRLTDAGIAIENRLRLIYPEESIISDHIIRPKIFLTTGEKKAAKDFLIQRSISFDSPLIMISVLGSEKRKTLPSPVMAAIIDEIVVSSQATILFNYIPSQKREAKEIFDKTRKETQKNIRFEVFGGSLRQFLAILSHCDALIGNEGGATNMAKALYKPTFTIFSPWIMKEAWNMFDDGIKNESIHLIDFKPDLYKNKSPKEMKKQAMALYNYFSLELILSKLKPYLERLNF